MGFLLFIVAFILVAIFAPLGIILTIIRSLLKADKKIINEYYTKLALSLDQFGNVALSTLFNIIFITSPEHLFGDEDETISSVLGKNEKADTLTSLGAALVWLLNWLDPNHAQKSIEN